MIPPCALACDSLVPCLQPSSSSSSTLPSDKRNISSFVEIIKRPCEQRVATVAACIATLGRILLRRIHPSTLVVDPARRSRCPGPPCFEQCFTLQVCKWLEITPTDIVCNRSSGLLREWPWSPPGTYELALKRKYQKPPAQGSSSNRAARVAFCFVLFVVGLHTSSHLREHQLRRTPRGSGVKPRGGGSSSWARGALPTSRSPPPPPQPPRVRPPLGPRSGLVGQGLLRVAFRAAFALI